jgi:hypothetical protein
MRRWDIFCRVVDNYGDIGTCWRLVQQLADEHQADVRLWVDNLGSFARLCPAISIDAIEQHVGPIEIRLWPADFPIVEVADVVIEAFACEIPSTYVTAMARRTVAPVWINLEYLSAEAWVEDCHLLASPHSTLPLTKYFFFPGFTPRTGGLLRERDLLSRSDDDVTPVGRARLPGSELETTNSDGQKCPSYAAAGFWRSVGIPPRIDGELRVSLFCYDNAALPDLLQCCDGTGRTLAEAGAQARHALSDQIVDRICFAVPFAARLRPPALGLRCEFCAR